MGILGRSLVASVSCPIPRVEGAVTMPRVIQKGGCRGGKRERGHRSQQHCPCLSVCPVRVDIWAWPVTPAVGRWPGAPAVPRPHCSLEALLPGLCHPGMTCSLVP